MGVRSRPLAGVENQISNPLLLCALVSLRTRQFVMAGNPNTSTAQLVDSALNQLVAGELEFERGKPGRAPLAPSETRSEEGEGAHELPSVPMISDVAHSVEVR
jgi:hypothetical protein